MENDITKQVQNKALEIFKIFRKICISYGLAYYAIGGTCIGAIRHHGFIPWDDDIDVAMPLKDYLKFREIAKKELKYPYELVDYMNNGYERLNFLKIHNIETTFVEKVEKDYPERYKGIFIDIMPVTGCPDDVKYANRFIKKIGFYRWLKRMRITSKEEISVKKRILWLLIHALTCVKQKKYYCQKWEEEVQKYEYGKYKNVLFPWRIPLEKPYSNVFPYDYFSEVIEVPFEDTYICVPKDYDGYLKKDFGDYMTLPPVEKRISSHNNEIIDANKSYKEYIKEMVK